LLPYLSFLFLEFSYVFFPDECVSSFSDILVSFYLHKNNYVFSVSLFDVLFHRTHSEIIPNENNSAWSEKEKKILPLHLVLGIEREIEHMCERQVERVPAMLILLQVKGPALDGQGPVS